MITVNVTTGDVFEAPDVVPHPTPAQSQAWVDAESNATTKRELEKIDVQSVRAMREFILAKFPGDPLLPPVLAGHNDAAAIERAKIK